MAKPGHAKRSNTHLAFRREFNFRNGTGGFWQLDTADSRRVRKTNELPGNSHLQFR